jgi:hypothetical protein
MGERVSVSTPHRRGDVLAVDLHSGRNIAPGGSPVSSVHFPLCDQVSCVEEKGCGVGLDRRLAVIAGRVAIRDHGIRGLRTGLSVLRRPAGGDPQAESDGGRRAHALKVALENVSRRSVRVIAATGSK